MFELYNYKIVEGIFVKSGQDVRLLLKRFLKSEPKGTAPMGEGTFRNGGIKHDTRFWTIRMSKDVANALDVEVGDTHGEYKE